MTYFIIFEIYLSFFIFINCYVQNDVSSLQLPVVCMYQHVEYIVMLEEIQSDLVIVEGPHTRLYGSEPNSSFHIDGDKLKIGQIFSVVTNFTLPGLEQDSPLQVTKTISEFKYF